MINRKTTFIAATICLAAEIALAQPAATEIVELSKALHKRLSAVEVMIAEAVATGDTSKLSTAANLAQDAVDLYGSKAMPLLRELPEGSVNVGAVFKCSQAPSPLADVARYLMKPQTPDALKERRLFLAEYRSSIEVCEKWLGLKPPAGGVGRGKSLEDF